MSSAPKCRSVFLLSPPRMSNPHPIIFDGEFDPALVVAQSEPNGLRTGMLENVSQGFPSDLIYHELRTWFGPDSRIQFGHELNFGFTAPDAQLEGSVYRQALRAQLSISEDPL